MPFSEDRFAKTRPFLFHLTDRGNLEGIRNSRTLYCAASLMRKADDTSFLRQRRAKSVRVQIGGIMISLRDQRPLYVGNMSLEGGWSFQDVIELLNKNVFFWPGTQDGPIGYGQRHFARYLDESPVILRVLTRELYHSNHGVLPQYCSYNSGSPRCSKGIGSPRGPNTFVAAFDADYVPSKVVEVTYRNQVTLPEFVEVSKSIYGPWSKL